MLIHAFYSDPHLGHANIIKYCNRPFASIAEMESELVRRYNEVVGPRDTVLWCGDAFFGDASRSKEILNNMNGRKILVKGNHDKSPAVMTEIGFDLCLTECTLRIAGRSCRVSHFPPAYPGVQDTEQTWKDKYKSLRPKLAKGEILIHGHTHSTERIRDNCIHVGVDAWDYRPALMSEVEGLVSQVKF